ncbi:spermatogenesis-associated protein 45 [Alosa pseudoharengus]|uniref:spermatogenesis-associated protein 45 n=1 Tax=Alosa pseudoharengus TaxID=34774 RepID=UPI003F8978C4
MAMAKAKHDELSELNVRRETWCRIEADSKFWQRPEKRHFDCHLQNTYDISALQTAPSVERTGWMEHTPSARTIERRHFEESYKSNLV